MDKRLQIRPMAAEDVALVNQSLQQHGIAKPETYIQRCWRENEAGTRLTLLAIYDSSFAGWLHLLSTSLYPYFVERGIPEINNFDVVPPLRRLGIGNALMEAIEQAAFQRHEVVGIGVGLFAEYGNAQRLYARRGYVPDGRGLMAKGLPVPQGSYVRVGNDLALYMIKEKPK